MFIQPQDDSILRINENTSSILPIAKLILAYANEYQHRYCVALIGVPGSGKTTLAEKLSLLINNISKTECSAVVGLDGWHYPNDYLDTHYIIKNKQTFPLRKIKGSPETFDAISAITCLRQIYHGQEISIPIYSRTLHNPIPHAFKIMANHKIIIFEGNYWLLDENNWEAAHPFFNYSIFIDADEYIIRQGLLQRHLKGGKNPEQINHQLQIDFENATRIRKNSIKTKLMVIRE